LYQYFDRFEIPANVVTVPRESDRFADKANEIRSRLEDASAQGNVFPWTMPDGSVLANSVNEVIDLVEELHTKKHSQRALRGNRPSPTALTLPDDLVHYDEPRIHTVRELARIQSFPDTFVFRAKVTTGGSRRRLEVPQYTQVGNAVPPMLAKAIGDVLFDLLSRVEGPETTPAR
jgi:DNA (cytosine-5)-methyltransferase 1